jgi:hypothetical protein
MERAAMAVASGAALLMATGGCTTTPTAPDHDASTDAPYGLDADVDGGLDAGESVPFCTQSADCPSGQICCAADAMTTACQAGPCPYLQSLGRSVQLCGTAAECFVAGDICSPMPCLTGLPLRYCNDPTPVRCGATRVPSDAGLDARGDDAAADTGATDASEGGATDAATDGAPADASVE